jgi:hypothetical protein
VVLPAAGDVLLERELRGTQGRLTTTGSRLPHASADVAAPEVLLPTVESLGGYEGSFDFWRPWNSITTTLDDGNAGTTTDPSWTALITAPYPEWTPGHNCLDASQVSVLRLFFGDTPGSFQITSASTFLAPAESKVRTFDTFSQPLAELIEARSWAGLHYRSSDVAGQVLGNNVARYGSRTTCSRWVIDHSSRWPSRNEKARSMRVFSTSRRAAPGAVSGRHLRVTAFALVRPNRAAEYRSYASRHSGGGGSPR